MSTLVTIQPTDLITNSRADLNTNFENLNDDKIETSVLDTDTALTANSDAKIPTQKAVKAYVDSAGSINSSTTVRGVVEEATNDEVLARTTTGGTGARLFINPSSLSQVVKFGGTGADGALTVTGATAIDLGSAQTVIKNYTSISITGTGALTFTNPHSTGTIIILKSQGSVEITSSATRAIDLRSLGGAAGVGGVSPGDNGTAGSNGIGTLYGIIGGNAGTSGNPPTAVAANTSMMPYFLNYANSFAVNLACGAGGGGGGRGTTAANQASGGNGGGSILGAGSVGAVGVVTGQVDQGGDGGRGAGALFIQCAGAYNCTGTIDASGIAGTTKATDSGSGGGGGGGTILVLYGSLTADSGTYTVTAGAAGNGAGGDGGAGNTGLAVRALNSMFT